MTIPFSVLRLIKLDESLGLSPLHREAIRTLPYGTNAKIHIAETMDPSFRYQLNTERTVDGTFIPSSTLWNSVSRQGTTIYLGGEAGANLDQNSANFLAQSILGKESSGPVVTTNWSQDLFARGSYSAPGFHSDSLNSLSDILPGLRAFADPIGRFYFAGEYTSADTSYMESAVQSGQIVAEHLLGNLS